MTKKSIMLKWAAIGSALYIVFGFIGFLIGLDRSSVLSFIIGIVISFPILMASFEFRDKYNGSFATMGEIFFQGLKITIFLMFVGAFWAYFYPTFLNKKYLDYKRIEDIEYMREYGYSKVEIDEYFAETDAKLAPLPLSVLEKFIKIFLLGLLVSLVSGLVIRNEKPSPYSKIETN